MLEHIAFVFIIFVALYFIYTQYYSCKEAFADYNMPAESKMANVPFW